MFDNTATPEDIVDGLETLEDIKSSYPGMTSEQVQELVESGALDVGDNFSCGERLGLRCWYELERELLATSRTSSPGTAHQTPTAN